MSGTDSRSKCLSVRLTEEEYGAIVETAALSGLWTAEWARDVLISRAVALHAQRESVMAA